VQPQAEFFHTFNVFDLYIKEPNVA